MREVEELALEVEELSAALTQALAERDAHRRRQVEAEQALMLLLIREGGRVEFTPKEMISAPADGSFVSSRDPVTGNEVLAFKAAQPGSGGLRDGGH